MRAVVFSNGNYDDLPGVAARLSPHDWLICADGALAKLVALGRWPDLLVGDFDSVDAGLLAEAKKRGVELLTFAQEKDYTDTELAWQEALQRGYRNFLVVGAWGGRLDHSLANLFLLAPFASPGCDIQLTDGTTDAYFVTDTLHLQNIGGKLVSILAFTPSAQGVTAQGFHWPLTEATLNWGQALGISNIPLADQATVSVRQGTLLVIVTPQD